jgi:hypothetical protein
LGITSDWDHASEIQGVNFPEVRQSCEGTPKASATRWKKANQAVMHTASEISSSFQSSNARLRNIVGGSVGGVGYQFHIVQQSTLRRGKTRFVRLAFDGCFYALLGCSLDPQEVGMAVQSIRTPVQIRNVAADPLFVAAGKMPFREMDGVS